MTTNKTGRKNWLQRIISISVKVIILVPFGACVVFLLLLGKCLGLSYKQIAVIFNLYTQGGLLLLSSLLPLVAACWAMVEEPNVTNGLLVTGGVVYVSIYVAGFVWMIRHYHLPMNYAFDLCVKDLKRLENSWGISYHAVNLVIFVLWWLTLVGMNVFVAYRVWP